MAGSKLRGQVSREAHRIAQSRRSTSNLLWAAMDLKIDRCAPGTARKDDERLVDAQQVR